MENSGLKIKQTAFAVNQNIAEQGSTNKRRLKRKGKHRKCPILSEFDQIQEDYAERK